MYRIRVHTTILAFQLFYIIHSQGSCSVPLGIAAENGHTETLERLLEAEAFVNYRNKVQHTLFT